jgi:glycerol-1-phosphatase
MEAEIPQRYGADAAEVPGARALLDALHALAAPWAIVTSGTRALAAGWLRALGLPAPRALVAAEDVARGKPDPEGYRAARERLLPPPGDDSAGGGDDGGGDGGGRRVLVVEDAPAGVAAGLAAGCDVVALATSHGAAAMRAGTRARWVVRDLRSVRVLGRDERTGGVRVEIRDSVVVDRERRAAD